MLRERIRLVEAKHGPKGGAKPQQSGGGEERDMSTMR
jgi:hypothetical protein